jgi:transcriptional regulator with XRE-family HTH domain
MDYIQKIKQLLSIKNIEQKELAKLIDKSPNTVNNYLQRKTIIDVETLLKIAEVLEVDIREFFGEGEHNDYTSLLLLLEENKFYLQEMFDDWIEEFTDYKELPPEGYKTWRDVPINLLRKIYHTYENDRCERIKSIINKSNHKKALEMLIKAGIIVIERPIHYYRAIIKNEPSF